MELAEDNAIFDRVISGNKFQHIKSFFIWWLFYLLIWFYAAPVDKYLRIVVTKEIKGIQYGVELVRAVKDKVVAEHKYGDEEDMALVEIMEFFRFRPLNKDSVLTFSFLATSNIAEVYEFKMVYHNMKINLLMKYWMFPLMKWTDWVLKSRIWRWYDHNESGEQECSWGIVEMASGWHQGLLSFDNFIIGKHFGFGIV